MEDFDGNRDDHVEDELHKELENLSGNLYGLIEGMLIQADQLQKALDSAITAKNQAGLLVEAIEERYEDDEAGFTALEGKVASLEADRNELCRQVDSLTEQNKDLIGENITLNERVEFLNRKNTSLIRALDEARRRSMSEGDLIGENITLNERVEFLNRKNTSLIRALDEARRRSMSEGLAEEHDRLEAANIALLAKNEGLGVELVELRERVRELESANAKHWADKGRLEAANALLKFQKGELQSAFTSLTKAQEKADQLKELKIAERDSHIERLEQQLADTQRVLRAKEKDVNLLKDQIGSIREFLA